MKSGVYTPGLKCLRPVLEEWIRLNIAIVKRWGDGADAPWWYNERASVSVFAGAVWTKGVYAMEEYANQKKTEDKPRAGRQDLEFAVGRHDFKAEAKQCWIPATRQQDHADRVTESMRQAIKDIRRCPTWGMQRLAMVFGAPYISKRRKAELPSIVDSFIRGIRNVDADAVAWVFPNLKRYPTNDNGYIHPGAVLWIKTVKR